MNSIDTSLTTSGNSVAVRLPKQLLRMSGLGKNVKLEAKKGKIIISAANNKRKNWDEQIKKLVEEHGDPSKEFADLNKAGLDGLDSAPWDGVSYEKWKKSRG